MSDQFFVSLDASSTTSSLKFRPKKKKKPSPFKPPPLPPNYQQMLHQQILHEQHMTSRHQQPLDLISNSSSIPSNCQPQQPRSLDHFDVNSIYASYNPYVTSQSVSSAHAHAIGPLLNQQHMSQGQCPPAVTRRPRPPPPPHSHKYPQHQLPPQFLPLQVFGTNDSHPQTSSSSNSSAHIMQPLHSPAIPAESLPVSEGAADHQRPKCSHCASMIIDEECTEAEGGVYHIRCFACSSCRRPLGGLQYIMHPVSDAGDVREPYCTDCFDSLFGEYCEGCGQLIHVAKGAAITHEGRSWHAIDCCFKCQNCEQSLLGLPFLPHSSGLIFCSVNCSKDAFNPRLRQSLNNQQHQQQQTLHNNSDQGTVSAASTPSVTHDHEHHHHAIHSLNCKSGSEIQDSGCITQLTRIQHDEATPPPLPSLSPSSGCSSSNSIQANSSSSSSSGPADQPHHKEQEERAPLEDSSFRRLPPAQQTSAAGRAGASAQDSAIYSSAGTSGRMDEDRGMQGLMPVPEEGGLADDSASSSYYACIGSLFNQPPIHHPHPSAAIPVNPSCSPGIPAASPVAADGREMIAIHAQSNQGVGSYHIRERDGHKNSPPPSPALPPKSPTVCLINSQSFATPVHGQENPAFKRDDADSSESNNNKNDLIEELESIQIADQSTVKPGKTVSFDETMQEKESSGGRRLRSRRRRSRRKHHHSSRRDHRRHRNHRSSHRCKAKSNNSDEEDEEEGEESDCSCSSCCSSSSCSESSCTTCSSSSSSDDEAGDSFDLQWPSQPNHSGAGVRSRSNQPAVGSEVSEGGSRVTMGRGGSNGHHLLTKSTGSIGTGSLTRPPPLRPDIKRQPNTACLIQ